jgi:XisI protein
LNKILVFPAIALPDKIMDILETYRELLEKILSERAAIPYTYGDVKTEVVFDRQRDRVIRDFIGSWVGWALGTKPNKNQRPGSVPGQPIQNPKSPYPSISLRISK